ncbi:hypothetical protein GF362_04115 [Candidatus Dojkabacteria bacterium]|nr:hypothetical protein [Candidatus Dojkabacteria bacterium]
MDYDTFDLDNLEVNIKINKKGSMLAQVELTYGSLKLYGYRVMKSDHGDGLFIQPPSVKAQNGKWLWLVRIDDQLKWSELQNLIKEEYKNAAKDYKDDEDDMTIDPDDIPF